MMAVPAIPPPPPPPMLIADEGHVEDAEHDDHDENMRSYSAEFQVEGIQNNRDEEDRLTEAEKNERVQKQLMVSYTIYTYILSDLFMKNNYTPAHLCSFGISQSSGSVVNKIMDI